MENKGILLCGETAEGKLAPITLQLLGIGRKLADELGEKLSILLMGSGLAGLGQQAVALGADRVYLADDPLLDNYNSDAGTYVAANLCQQLLPAILLLGQTDVGRDLAPRLAGRLKTGLAMDCTALAIDPQTRLLIRTRPVYGGNADATVISRTTRPQMATIRTGMMKPAEPDDSRRGEVIAWGGTIDPSVIKVKVIERVKEEREGVRLEEADVVVSGGRGMGSSENFKAIENLAHLLGGAMGATRIACEEKWVPATYQVGQTGKMVSPKLYIAVAISGATQHLAGCAGSRCIVAINKDPQANIFKVAHLGIIGDWKEALPALTRKLEELLAK
ncbi:MAG: Electron transfer flavoprotein subunit alpha [Dehalococcoidales bacterium]|nr:Electron transfer flavoprotein subunit alpha [Dehalococcoidales bacterium]